MKIETAAEAKAKIAEAKAKAEAEAAQKAALESALTPQERYWADFLVERLIAAGGETTITPAELGITFEESQYEEVVYDHGWDPNRPHWTVKRSLWRLRKDDADALKRVSEILWLCGYRVDCTDWRCWSTPNKVLRISFK